MGGLVHQRDLESREPGFRTEGAVAGTADKSGTAGNDKSKATGEKYARIAELKAQAGKKLGVKS